MENGSKEVRLVHAGEEGVGVRGVHVGEEVRGVLGERERVGHIKKEGWDKRRGSERSA